jgi:UDP-glucose 4-epimerase
VIVSPRREGDPPILVASAEKARKLLDWSPRYLDIEEIIETAWRWHTRAPQTLAATASGLDAPDRV